MAGATNLNLFTNLTLNLYFLLKYPEELPSIQIKICENCFGLFVTYLVIKKYY